MSSYIEYILHPADQKPVHFRVSLDPFSDTYAFPDPGDAPEWTYLENNICSHCPLQTQDYKLCPLAERVVPFVSKLSHLCSTEEMRLDVVQSGRTKDETVYRVMSMYRLGQFMKKAKTGRAYAGFGKLEYLYEQMVEVNHKLSERMRVALASQENRQDGTINAITILDALSQYVPASIEDAIEDLEPIFLGYWD
jgi:hypothetical protein